MDLLELVSDLEGSTEREWKRLKTSNLVETEALEPTSSDIKKKLDLDRIIEALTSLNKRQISDRNNLPLSEADITTLCQMAREIFSNQPMLLEIEIQASKINICGDIHGQFEDLLRIFQSGGSPSETGYLFLGDYVDRGIKSIETICLLFAFKVKYPDTFFLLRGNHEDSAINRLYGFYDECKRRYSMKLWKTFQSVFNMMPIAALVENRIFCMHGGISPDLEDFDQIRNIARPVENIPPSGVMCDLLWADPSSDPSVTEWGDNSRGVSYEFGPEAVKKFLEKFDLDLICRAHQMVQDGYQFFANRRVVTVFSAPNYCQVFDNAGAFLTVDENLVCRFTILKPNFSDSGSESDEEDNFDEEVCKYSV